MKKIVCHNPPSHRLLGGVLLILLVSFLTVPVAGQTVTLSRRFRVLDSNGAAVPGATIIMTEKDKGRSWTAITADDGSAVIETLIPSIYDITVEVSGFKKLELKSLEVTVDQASVIDLVFTIESEKHFIALAGAAIENTPEEISPLPNLYNDLTPLLQVVPGSVATGLAALGRVIIDGKVNDQQTIRLD